MKRTVWYVLFAALAAAAASGARTAEAASVCNGAAALCAVPFDEVAFPTTHNAFATYQNGYNLFNGNQTYTMTRQMEDGVRALMLDTHDFGGVVSLCHGVGFCPLANRPLADGLQEVKDFLDANPEEVIALIFEAYASSSATEAVFEQVGLLDTADPSNDYLYVHTGGPWPTLGDLIDSGERLFVLTDVNAQATYPWYHYLWSSLAFETHFSAETPADFSCADNRGSPGNDLFILNHFLTGPLGASPQLAGQANYNDLFIDRALECQAFHGRIPNFVTVDFYEIGDVMNVAKELNGLCADADFDGYTDCRGDCDDADAAVNPGAAEVPGNGIDDNCNGAVDETPGGCAPVSSSSRGAMPWGMVAVVAGVVGGIVLARRRCPPGA